MPLGLRKVSLTWRRTSKSGGVFYLVIITPAFNILEFQNSGFQNTLDYRYFGDMFFKNRNHLHLGNYFNRSLDPVRKLI